MKTSANVLSLQQGLPQIVGGSRPDPEEGGKVHKSGAVYIQTARGLRVHSLLREDEWHQLDSAVLTAVRYPLRAVADLKSKGLIHTLGGLGTLISTWYTQSAVTPAHVNMSGQGGAERDLPDLAQVGVPVPVIFKEFSIDIRTLQASRMNGDALDVTAGAEAARVVAESLESLMVAGHGTRLNGTPLYGYRNHPSRNTDSATGDWGTITNILPTITKLVNGLNADHYYGPYMVYLSTDQYNEASLTYFTDGSGDTPLDRIKRMSQIEDVRMLPPEVLPSGEIIGVEMRQGVVDWAEALDIQVREWVSGDGMQSMFKVMAVAAPRIKAHYGGQCGVMHITGA